MNWKLFGGFGVLISVILALSLGLTLPKKNADPDQDTETHTLTSKIYYLGLGSMASIVAERSEAREPNGKQTSELNSVGPKTPKSIKIFLIRTTSGDDVITADKTSKAFTAVVVVDIKKRGYDSRNSFL